uniref:costars family protein ABRACL n=1 Tax=Scatophagus argus TaxID=75038 RepID=UPI001ED7D8BB|nr:costars family protein ABRACL [Scatophagus argus]
MFPSFRGYSERSNIIHWSRFNTTMDVSHEINLLVQEIQRLGSKNADGQTSVKFGVLFNDDRCANIFEALVGTLKAAKKKKVVTFQGELLLQGVHDNVDVILLQE